MAIPSNQSANTVFDTSGVVAGDGTPLSVPTSCWLSPLWISVGVPDTTIKPVFDSMLLIKYKNTVMPQAHIDVKMLFSHFDGAIKLCTLNVNFSDIYMETCLWYVLTSLVC